MQNQQACRRFETGFSPIDCCGVQKSISIRANEKWETNVTTKTGGCLCGAVRYTLSGDLMATAVCHCRNCQKQAGSALSVVAVVARDALVVEGKLSVFEDKGTSGQTVYRKFCGKCGSPVLTDTPAALASDIIFIKAGSFDDVSDLKPSTHYWTKSAQPWFTFPDGAELLETE